MPTSALSIEIRSNRLERALAIAPDAVERHLGTRLAKGAAKTARLMRRNAPKAFTTLTQSIKDTRVGPLAWSTKPHVHYAGYVEEGTGPGGHPPLEALESWIRVHGIIPDDPDMTLEDLAFAMQDSISAKGTPAQPFVTPTWKEIRPEIESEAMDGLSVALREVGLQ